MNIYKKYNILDIYRLPQTVFTAKDISLIWKETNMNNLKARLNYYVKTGKLFKIRRGIYARDKNYDKLEMATRIYTPAYISLETITGMNGMTFQYYETLFVISYLTREIKCDGQNIQLRRMGREILSNTTGLKNMGSYFMATPERAFLDAIYIYKNYYFDNLRPLNWKLCYKLLSIYQSKVMKKRLDSYYKDFKEKYV